jgi:FkbM family methyltransferase
MLEVLAERWPATREPILLAWKRGWLKPPSGVGVATLADGRRLECNLEDRTQRRMFYDRFEPTETATVRSLLGPGDVVIDVGAHIGWFTTLAGKAVGEAGHVYAFEAYPPNFERLQDNVRRNAAGNVTARHVALSDRAGSVEVGVQTGSDSGSVTALGRERASTVEVTAERLDDVLGVQTSPIALLKMDVEGFEANVLKGAPQTLLLVQKVLIEINPHALQAAGSSAAELMAILAEAGLTASTELREKGLRRLKRGRTSTNLLVARE